MTGSEKKEKNKIKCQFDEVQPVPILFRAAENLYSMQNGNACRLSFLSSKG